MASLLPVPPPPAAAVGASSSTSSVLRQPTGPGYTTATTLNRGDAAMRGATRRVGATGEALEASKAVLLAAVDAVKVAEGAVAAAAEADFRGKAVLLAAQGAVKATEEAVAATEEAEYFICIGRL